MPGAQFWEYGLLTKKLLLPIGAVFLPTCPYIARSIEDYFDNGVIVIVPDLPERPTKTTYMSLQRKLRTTRSTRKRTKMLIWAWKLPRKGTAKNADNKR
ncbi:hypothetical protein BDW59DRAFT_145399 [Aspergillus cavernicola]|uniref:Uncharacterized protein n=1 Tax=Aspergillus cavernicola TaxID=176166 RepID=A0ABR4IFJ9_9EURO